MGCTESPPPVQEAEQEPPQFETLELPPPVSKVHAAERSIKWMPERKRCDKKAGRRFCDGPRRVPTPHGPENELANALGLGSFTSAAELLRSSPQARWRVQGELPEQLFWPIEFGRFGRGVSKVPKHRGVDITAELGTEVHLVADGMVAYANNEVSGYGNLLIVLHPGDSVSAYAHLSEIRVFPGQRKRAGDVVALSGNTGLSRGPHLHFEWRQKGRSLSPMSLFAPKHRRGSRHTKSAKIDSLP